MVARTFARVCPLLLVAAVMSEAVAQRYNPYAQGPEILAPVARDGTLQWGTFYKSAQLQQTYERLWNLGACRGTNKAITEPVENNKVLIDRLPEGDYAGVVQAASGPLAGGVVAFADKAAGGQAAWLFAQLHPAGVSQLTVTGTIQAGQVIPGMVVKLRAAVDTRGRGTDPVRSFVVVTPADTLVPQPVVADRLDTIVGAVVSIRPGTLVVRVDVGKLRRLTFTLADDAVVTVDAARLDLVAQGDAITVKGRLWSGAGSAGAGTIFASHVTVTKRPPPVPQPQAVAAGAGARLVEPVQ